MLLHHGSQKTTTNRGYFAHDCNQCKCTRPFLSMNLTEKENLKLGIVTVLTIQDDGLGRDVALCDFCGYKIRYKARVVTNQVDWTSDIDAIMRETKAKMDRRDAPPNMTLAWARLNLDIKTINQSTCSISRLLVINGILAAGISFLEIAAGSLLLHANKAMPDNIFTYVFMVNFMIMTVHAQLKRNRKVASCIRERGGKLLHFYKVPIKEIELGRDAVRSPLFTQVIHSLG